MRNGVTTILLSGTAALAWVAAGCTMDPDWWKPTDPAVARVDKGQALLKAGNLEAAKAELAAAIRANPNLPQAHAALGDAYRKEKDYTSARDSYVRACELDPYAFRPHYNLGVTYQVLAARAAMLDQARKFLQDAVQVYLRAATIKPDDFEANLNLSACYHQLGREEQAEMHCRRALDLKPDNASAWCNLGIVCDAQGKNDEAVRAFKRSLEYDTNQPRVLLALGACHKRSASPERFKAALHVFRLALRMDPNCAEAYEQIALVCFETGEYSEALAAFEKAAALDPNSSVAHRGLGAVYILRYLADPTDETSRRKGLTGWTRSLELDPDQPKLAELIARYQRPASARQDLAAPPVNPPAPPAPAAPDSRPALPVVDVKPVVAPAPLAAPAPPSPAPESRPAPPAPTVLEMKPVPPPPSAPRPASPQTMPASAPAVAG